VHLVCKAFEDLQEEEVQEELPALWENLEIMDRMVKLESLVFKVFLEDLVLWELLEIKVPLVIKVLKVLLEYLVHQELEATQAKMDVREGVDHQETPDQQEKEDYQAALGQEVSRECQVLLERMVWLVKMEKQVCKDHRE